MRKNGAKSACHLATDPVRLPSGLEVITEQNRVAIVKPQGEGSEFAGVQLGGLHHRKQPFDCVRRGIPNLNRGRSAVCPARPMPRGLPRNDRGYEDGLSPRGGGGPRARRDE